MKKLINEGDAKNPDWQYLWDNCIVDEKAKGKINWAIDQYLENIDKYKFIEDQTGVPKWFVAGIHMRESGFNFDGCLHNGDPWHLKTKNVPKGRGPWESWEEAAVDALAYDKVTKETTNTIVKCLDRALKYNGLGYRSRTGDRGVIEYSPYVCAYTNWHDETSKFVSDGRYDKNAPEKQLGIMAFWKALENRSLIQVS